MWPIFSPVILGVMVHAGLAVGLLFWGRWVGRRHDSRPWWRRASWLPLVALGLSLASAAISTAHIMDAFEAVSGSTDPAAKATLLADSIARSLHAVALLALPANALLLISLVLSTVGSLIQQGDRQSRGENQHDVRGRT